MTEVKYVARMAQIESGMELIDSSKKLLIEELMALRAELGVIRKGKW